MSAAVMDPRTDARALLERRARELARRPAQVAPGGTVELVEFRIAGERYAVEAREVLTAFALTDLAPLPGATAPVAGVTIWRGRLVTLLDVRPLLGLSSAALNDLRMVAVLGDTRGSAGILVDALVGTCTRRADEFRVDGMRAKQGGHVRGLSSDALTLLDGGALVRHHETGGRPE